VILSLTLQTFFLTLLVSNRQLAASYQINLGGIAGSFIFAKFLNYFGRISLLRLLLFA
jgi:hypothetical protein